jgi:hypothetical protein
MGDSATNVDLDSIIMRLLEGEHGAIAYGLLRRILDIYRWTSWILAKADDHTNCLD